MVLISMMDSMIRMKIPISPNLSSMEPISLVSYKKSSNAL